MIHNQHLEGGPFHWRGGPVGVLLIHGLTATVAEVRPLGKRLHAAGYTVTAPLLPGHYTRPEDLNRVRWQDWTAAVTRAYQALAGECPQVVVGGESTGALLSLYLAQQHPQIAALLLYAPALQLAMRAFDRLRMRLLAPFVPWTPKTQLDSNPRWQGYTVNPLKGALQLLALQKVVRPGLNRVRQPLLIVQGRLDRTVDLRVPEIIAREAGSQVIETHWMERSAHCVILDCELDAVERITLEFLQRVVSAA